MQYFARGHTEQEATGKRVKKNTDTNYFPPGFAHDANELFYPLLFWQ
jgi:hypothetical protein